MAMNEKKVYVQCRKVDEAVVKAQIAGAKKGYEMIMSKSVAKEGIKVTTFLIAFLSFCLRHRAHLAWCARLII
jgi:L-lactate utilization protein LutB